MIFLQMLVWYLVGFVCMNFLRHWLEKRGLILGRQEVYVLAVTGPFVALLILYLLVMEKSGRL
jgi:uncharacterized membrane protein